jgi:hypothetical protein
MSKPKNAPNHLHARKAKCNVKTKVELEHRHFELGFEEQLNIFASYFAKSGSKDQSSAFFARERAIQLMSELVGAVILTPVWCTSRCFKHLFGRFEIPATTPRGSRTRPRANGSSSFVPS